MATEKFKDLFLFVPKSKIKARDGLKKGRFPFYTSSPTLSKWIHTEQHFDEALVFGTGGIPSIHYVNEPFSTSTDCLVAIARTNNSFNVKFVYYFIYGNIRILEKGFKGAGLKHISKAYIEKLEILLPDIETQNKAVAILDKAKNLIEKRERTIQIFDELLRATFLDMFGQPNKNKNNNDVLENISLKITDGTHQSPNFLNKGVPFLLVSNIVNNEIIYKTKKFISEEEYIKLNKRTPIEIGDILITSVGSYGKPAIVKTITKFAFQRHIAYIKPDKSKINNIYLYYALRSDYVNFQIERVVKGAAQKTLNLSGLRKITIPVPDIQLQNKFEIIYLKFEKYKSNLIQSKTQLENLLGGLSQSAFNGDLKFNTAVDLEILMENDYAFFKKHSDKKAIQLLLDRIDKDILNKKKFYEEELYNRAKMFVFNLLEDKKIEQVYEQEKIRLVVK